MDLLPCDGLCTPENYYTSDACGNSYYLGTRYIITSCPTKRQPWKCVNGKWKRWGGDDPYTSCDTGYSRDDPSNFWGCNNPSGPCTDGQETIVDSACKGNCDWDGNYQASCSGYEYYYCSFGDDLVGRTCYSCSIGSYSNGTCEYSCTKYYDYWEYNITINYYVIK